MADDPARGEGDANGAADVPPDLRRTFWRLVAVFNVALLAAGVGVMLIGFEGQLRDGGALVAIGVGAFLYGYRGYRRQQKG